MIEIAAALIWMQLRRLGVVVMMVQRLVTGMALAARDGEQFLCVAVARVVASIEKRRLAKRCGRYATGKCKLVARRSTQALIVQGDTNVALVSRGLRRGDR